MIVPSIDLMNGHAVQLVGGEELEIDGGDPRPWAEKFALAGDVAVIDLDAALGKGDNAVVIEDLLTRARCRVGGGIRDVQTALQWLDRGAHQIILGTAATPEILSQLPRERVIVALDAKHGEVVVDGWRTRTGERIEDRLARLSGLASGFLVTAVEREGRMAGFDRKRVAGLVAAAADARVTIAGGVTTAADVAALDAMGADAQVGMALYRGTMDLGDAIAAPLRNPPAVLVPPASGAGAVSSSPSEGLWPTMVVDEHGVALGLAWSSVESLKRAVATRRGVYWSRSRNTLWEKGATSGASQELLAIDLDCDRDALRFTVKQAAPGFCHEDSWTCFGAAGGLPELDRRLAERKVHAPAGSYTHRLFADPVLLESKLMEESRELLAAETPHEATHEATDVVYFAMVAAHARGVDLAAIGRELDRRALAVTRRRGDAKP